LRRFLIFFWPTTFAKKKKEEILGFFFRRQQKKHMGQHFADQFSLLHFSVGVVAYFWGVPLAWWFVAHTVFELGENSPTGIRLINSMSLWPGGKPEPDSLLNIAGDTAFAMAGWMVACALDRVGDRLGWYDRSTTQK
tara:strand:- start:4123 stop:4533 length:411 start_codon:yes stop_codon:yes gene_type:complete